MFENFPKTRPVLPKHYADIYSAHYKTNREGKTFATSLSQKMEIWLHKQVARDLAEGCTGKATLEIGAGTLNQLSHEPNVGPYDIVEPFERLYRESPALGRIRNIYSDIHEIPSTQRYDRITSIAAFEHICDLPQVVANAALLLKAGGALRVAIPSEGTMLWWLGWKLTTGLGFKVKYGLDYGVLMRYEHVNTAKEIEEVLTYFFSDVTDTFCGLGKALSIYQFFVCKRPIEERCREFAHLAVSTVRETKGGDLIPTATNALAPDSTNAREE